MKNISSVVYSVKELLVNSKLSHILEFGVFRGKTIKQIKSFADNRFKIFGFDSFYGLPEDWITKDGKLVQGKACKGYFSTEGKIPDIKGVHFFKGWFKDTIPVYLRIAEPIAMMHIDSDLYESAKQILWGLNEHIHRDTIIVFDEWIYERNPNFDDHEQKAFYEWCKHFDRKFEFVKNIHTKVPSLKAACQKIVRIVS